MRKDKKLANILNECLERLLLKGETLDQCLASYPELASELEPLLNTALVAKEASAIQPHPDFRARSRYQFQSALRDIEPKGGLRWFGWQPRWAVAVSAVLVLLLAGGGTVAAAGNSMPDETLYPVKLATEQVRLTLTPSELGKAQLYVTFADRRVHEIVRMGEEGKPELVEQATRRLDTHLAMIVRLVSAPEKEAAVLMAPLPAARAPEPSDKAGSVPPPVPAPAPPPGPITSEKDNRRAELRAVVAQYAALDQEALRAALEKAPPEAIPALRTAIDTSVAGYEKALEALD